MQWLCHLANRILDIFPNASLGTTAIYAYITLRTYRGFSSRQIVSQLMYDRETINRRDKIRSLAAEEDSIMEHIVILEKR